MVVVSNFEISLISKKLEINGWRGEGLSIGSKGRVAIILAIMVTSSLFAVSLNTVSADGSNIIVNGKFLTGDLSGWTLEYASAGGVESLSYKPAISTGGHDGSNFVNSAYYNFGYSTYRIVQKLPQVSSTNKNASCWTSWSFGGYLKVNYTDGTFDQVDIPERLSMASWTQTVLPLAPGKTLDCISIHGCGSGGHNGGLTVSDIQITASGTNMHPSNTQLSQLWLHERFFWPSAVSGLNSLIEKYILSAAKS
jgi:hypothetical protein